MSKLSYRTGLLSACTHLLILSVLVSFVRAGGKEIKVKYNEAESSPLATSNSSSPSLIESLQSSDPQQQQHHGQNNQHHHRHHNSNSSHHKQKHHKLKKQLLSGDQSANSNNNNNNNLNSLQRDYLATTVGKDVQIDCKMKNVNADDEKIVWLKMPKGEVLTLNGNRVTQDARVSTKCVGNVVPCWSLIIVNTREQDTGFYVCQTNAMQTKYVYLDIMGRLDCR
jgi:hypothetical protein